MALIRWHSGSQASLVEGSNDLFVTHSAESDNAVLSEEAATDERTRVREDTYEDEILLSPYSDANHATCPILEEDSDLQETGQECMIAEQQLFDLDIKPPGEPELARIPQGQASFKSDDESDVSEWPPLVAKAQRL